MGAMSDIATELECHWRASAIEGRYDRLMPNGSSVVIWPPDREGLPWELRIGAGCSEFDSLAEAVVAAGKIAQEQLREQSLTWQQVAPE